MNESFLKCKVCSMFLPLDLKIKIILNPRGRGVTLDALPYLHAYSGDRKEWVTLGSNNTKSKL